MPKVGFFFFFLCHTLSSANTCIWLRVTWGAKEVWRRDEVSLGSRHVKNIKSAAVNDTLLRTRYELRSGGAGDLSSNCRRVQTMRERRCNMCLAKLWLLSILVLLVLSIQCVLASKKTNGSGTTLWCKWTVTCTSGQCLAHSLHH